MTARMVPAPVGPSAQFYEWLARGELRLQKCSSCAAWQHPPRYRCAACGSDAWTFEPASGRGEVFSWTITHRAVDPAFEPPYSIVIVELAEGPRLVGNPKGIVPDELALGMPVVVEIEPVSDTVGLIWFRPA